MISNINFMFESVLRNLYDFLLFLLFTVCLEKVTEHLLDAKYLIAYCICKYMLHVFKMVKYLVKMLWAIICRLKGS